MEWKLIWSEERIQFFMGDFLTFDFQKEKNNIEVWPFDKPFFLKLMLAVGLLNDFNDGGDKVDDSIFPAKMFIDYVRIYKNKTTIP